MKQKRRNACVAIIEEITWNSSNTTMTIEGYSYINGVDIKKRSDVKKSISIALSKQKFYVPLVNEERADLVRCSDGHNYRYAGFKGTLDLGYINSMDSLSPGNWSLNINIIVNDVEIEIPVLYRGNLDNIEPMLVINKKNKRYVNIMPYIEDERLYIQSSVDESVTVEEKMSAKDKFNNTVHEVLQWLHDEKLKIVGYIYKLFKSMPLKYNRVLFLSDSRANMNGNFEFVYKELIARGGFDIKSILKPSIDAKWNIVEKFKFLYYVATSKYIILDDFYPKIYEFKLRKDVELIQLWHACGAFKTFGFSRLGKAGGPKLRSKNHRNYTRAIVSSENIRKHYAEGFGISVNKVVATGVPRTDIFFDEKYATEITNKIKGKYPILQNKKVIMFAPTFRGNGQKTAYYDFDKFDIDMLYNNLKEEYVIIMKIHPFVKNIPKIDEKYSDFIIDLSKEREINDLLFVSDILITDYSSVCFEFALLNRPMIFFAYDMNSYIGKRDFYYPYEGFVPGKIAKTTKDIVNIINKNQFDLAKLESFRNRFFTHLDGKSTQRVVDMIVGLQDKKK